MAPGRGSLIGSVMVIVGLLGASIGTQVLRDRWFNTDQPARQILYVQSPAVMKRVALSYQGLAADVYWIRAIQYFGGTHRGVLHDSQYELLYPLLNMSTSLDPRFNIAYRFGAIFLSEAAPGGPGRPDLAVALLQKGIAEMPEKWQYYQDLGFVHYWARGDYRSAAEWFEKGGAIAGAPWWLKPLAAHTLAQGGDRRTSRLLYGALAQSQENEFMQRDAQRRLRQLDAMDARDALQAAVDRFKREGGGPPFTWERLARAGRVRGIPLDPDGTPYDIGPYTGDVALGEKSPLLPLPSEPQAAPRAEPPAPPAAAPPQTPQPSPSRP